MAIRIAINGFGRIGRNVFRIMHARSADFEIVALNDLTDAKTLAHLLKYDTVGGRFDGKGEVDGDAIVVDGKRIQILAERNPADLPWGDLGVDFVVESTGIFRKREQCQMHIDAGAKKVLLTVPPADEIDNMVVLGVNDETLTADQKILFCPDKNLGAWLIKQTGRDMELWQGTCIVHETFSEQKLIHLKTRHPEAKVICHPECEPNLLRYAHHIGSTSSLLNYATTTPDADTFIVGTEPGILHQMEKAAPDRTFLPLPGMDETCACNECPYMRLNTLEKIRNALRDMQPQIQMPEDLRLAALAPLERMMALG